MLPLQEAGKPIGAEGVNLIPLQLGMFERRRQHDRAAVLVDALGELESSLERMPKTTA